MRKFLSVLIGTIVGDMLFHYVIEPKLNDKK